MAKPCSIHNFSTTCNFSENEAPLPWVSCYHRRGCAALRSSGILFEYPEISAARQAHNTRFETRADTMMMMMMGKRMSACCGRCCRPQIAVISSYRILGRVFPPTWGVRNTKCNTASSPKWRSNPGPRAQQVPP